MRVPLRHIAGHLAWSVHGHAWAVYRIHPGPDARGQVQESVPGTYIPAPVRTELLEQVTTLVRSLSGAAPRLFGLCAQVDAAEVVWRMTEGLHDGDGGLRPGAQGWVEHLEAALDLLEGQEMHQRTWWLAVPLERENQKLKAASALWADVADAFGLRAGPVTVAEVNTCREQAARVEAHLSGGVPMRPAAPAEIVWMIQHALHRGLAEPLLGEAARSQAYGGQVTSGVLHSPSYADLGQVRLEEGGTERSAGTAPGSSSSSRGPARRGRVKRWHKKQGGGSPLRRRWLQIETDHGTGYQAHLALAECPRAVAAEAADLFAQLEVLDFPVDFTIDLMLVGAEKARQQVQRKKNELVDQADQYDAQPTGMPASIPDAAGDLGELDRRLSHTSVEVEVQSVTALHVWGPNAALCDARARALEKLLAGADYRAVRPAGLQAELFMLGLPGTVRPQRLREFTQYQLSEDWAMSGAFTHREVGDPNGIFVGLDLDCGTTRPVLLNVADAPKQDASASFGIVADLGAGKSVLQKLTSSCVVDRGARAICIDRTPVREWALFAQAAAPGRCQIIDAARAALSIDPLRLFPGPEGRHYALSYLTLQLGIGPMTTAGEVLHHAVEQATTTAEPSMHQVLQVLARMAQAKSGKRQDAAATLSGLLRIVADNPLAAMVFDPALPPVRVDGADSSDIIVITTAGLTLPPKNALSHPEMLHQQPLEALIGRAVLYLIAAIARQAAFYDLDRFCAFVTDELYWLTSSAEGTALVHEVLHDGRKHAAGLIAGAPTAEELGPDRGLMAYRALGRTTNREHARSGLEFIGLDPDDTELVRMVTSLSPVGRMDRAGEFLLTAPRQNTGRIKVVIPAVARIASRITTTPGQPVADASPPAEPGPARVSTRKGGQP